MNIRFGVDIRLKALSVHNGGGDIHLIILTRQIMTENKIIENLRGEVRP